VPGGRSKNESVPTGGNESQAKWETQQQAIQLRAAGATYREIGRALKIDHTWARRLVVDGVREAITEDVGELRREQGVRLERMLRGVYADATKGDHRAINSVLRILERQSRLFGLDAPLQLQVAGSELDQQIEALIDELRTVPGEVVTGDDDGRGPMAVNAGGGEARPDPQAQGGASS